MLLLLALFLLLDSQLRPLVETMLVSQARAAFTEAVNAAVLDTSDDAAGFVSLGSGRDGGVVSVSTDTAQINGYKAAVSAAVTERLDNMRSEPIRVPVGSLTGIEMLTGRGPCVRLRLIEKGSVTADIRSSFTAAGINQTCHRIICVVNADYYAVIPGFRTPVSLEATVVIAESIIVGDVPESFTYVNGDSSDTVGRIFDYGDPYGSDVLE